jgi:hypothetical protein
MGDQNPTGHNGPILAWQESEEEGCKIILEQDVLTPAVWVLANSVYLAGPPLGQTAQAEKYPEAKVIQNANIDGFRLENSKDGKQTLILDYREKGECRGAWLGVWGGSPEIARQWVQKANAVMGKPDQPSHVDNKIYTHATFG